MLYNGSSSYVTTTGAMIFWDCILKRGCLSSGDIYNVRPSKKTEEGGGIEGKKGGSYNRGDHGKIAKHCTKQQQIQQWEIFKTSNLVQSQLEAYLHRPGWARRWNQSCYLMSSTGPSARQPTHCWVHYSMQWAPRRAGTGHSICQTKRQDLSVLGSSKRCEQSLLNC